jgi:hypothetical protein
VTLHLTLFKAMPVPSAQLRIVWQGMRIGDTAAASWTEPACGKVWRAERNLPWLQRDPFASGEEWKINLAGVPAGVDTITFHVASSTPRTVGMAILPLAGDPDDGMVHPGTELIDDRYCALLQLRSVGGQWTVVATNTVRQEAMPESAGPTASGARHGDVETAQLAPPFETVRQIPIPEHLQPAVDKIRAAGAAVRRTHIDAVVDISASMRPWLAAGMVADTLSAVLAVTGASSRPSLSLWFTPGGGPIDLPLDASPGEALGREIGHRGLQTGSHLRLQAAIEQAADRGGVVFVISDNPVVPPTGASVVSVVLGDPPPGPHGGSPFPGSVVAVGTGPVDVGVLARDLAMRVREPEPR